jgi:putative exporter of polyketide antibiotics
MTAYTMSQTLTNLRQALRRYAWWLSLSLVLVMAALAAYRSISMPAAAAAVASSAPQTISVNPAQQGVFDYLWAHSCNQPIQATAAALDPAQQSVMDYLHAHDRVDRPPAFWDQAAQAVRDYLRAHSR